MVPSRVVVPDRVVPTSMVRSRAVVPCRMVPSTYLFSIGLGGRAGSRMQFINSTGECWFIIVCYLVIYSMSLIFRCLQVPVPIGTCLSYGRHLGSPRHHNELVLGTQVCRHPGSGGH
jgi:hypothetical protein